MKPYVCILVLVVFLFYNNAAGQITARKIDNLMQQYFDYGEFNGTVLVSQNGNVIFKKGYGYANIEKKIPNTSETKFYIGSITKAFTDLLVLQMAEKGMIELHAKISDYLPGYPKPNGDSVTIYNLLTHTSGIPDYDSDPRIDVDWSKHYSHQEMLALFDSLPLLFTPGTTFRYTNAGAFICGVILEKLTGKSYNELLKENILDPLQMKNTGYTESNAPIDKFATGYDMSGVKPVAQSYIDMSTTFSAFGMYSTAEDMQKWNKALHTEKLLSKKYMEIYFTAFKDNWACDWVVAKNPFHNAGDSTIVTMRAGTLGQFECMDVRFVKEKHSIVFMGNTRFSRMEEMQKNITAILFNKPYTLPKQSLQKIFAKIADKKSLDEATDEILTKAKDANKYYISASEFLHIGFQYKYGKKDLKSAIRVFELIAKLFPATYNAYDSQFLPDSSNVYGILGETYMEDGQKDKAIIALKKATALNPDDSQSAELLNKLEKQR
jgi:CubicO group peptidase (beta-lactamase class C family)